MEFHETEGTSRTNGPDGIHATMGCNHGTNGFKNSANGRYGPFGTDTGNGTNEANGAEHRWNQWN